MTLNQLVDDILNTCNYIDPDKGKNILRRHVEAWIGQYRLVIIDRDINKNSIIDPSYISYMDFETEVATDPVFYKGLDAFDTKKELPRIPQLTGRFGIMSIMDKETGDDLDLKDISRALFASYNRFTAHMAFCSVIDHKIRVWKKQEATPVPPTIRCGLILSDPADLYSDPYDDQKIFFKDQEYPMPADKIWLLKQMIYSHELNWIKPSALQEYQQRLSDEGNIDNMPRQEQAAGAHLYEE